jgi:hypothetical protein
MNLPVNYKEIHYSEKWRVREAYIKLQNGLCYHCGKPLDGDPPESITRLNVNRALFPKQNFNLMRKKSPTLRWGLNFAI